MANRIKLLCLAFILLFNFKAFANTGDWNNNPVQNIRVRMIEQDYGKYCPINYHEDYVFFAEDYSKSPTKFYSNIFELLNREYNLSNSKSLMLLSNFYSGKKPVKLADKSKSKKEILYEINEEACKFFENNLYSSHGKKGLEYLKNRQITDSNIQNYRIGWAIDNDYALLNHLKYLGYSEEDIVDAGLAVDLKRHTIDTIRNRITFPIMDKNGRIIGYSARQLIDMRPKYINMRKTKIHDVEKIFFNQYQSQDKIKKTKSVIVFEGNFDSLMSYFHGIKNTVSLMGITISDYQIKKLFKQADTVYLCLDSDIAGINATRELSEQMLPYITRGKNLKIVHLPPHLDVDEIILKHGKNKLLDIIDDAQNIPEYFWNYEYKEALNKYHHDLTAKEKIKLKIKMFYIGQKISNPELRLEFMEYYNKQLEKI